MMIVMQINLSSSLVSVSADASRLLPPPGSGSFQEVVCVVSRGPPANHRLPGALSRLFGAPGVQAPAVGRHHHPGPHQRHDRTPALQEAEGRGEHTHMHIGLEISTFTQVLH